MKYVLWMVSLCLLSTNSYGMGKGPAKEPKPTLRNVTQEDVRLDRVWYSCKSSYSPFKSSDPYAYDVAGFSKRTVPQAKTAAVSRCREYAPYYGKSPAACRVVSCYGPHYGPSDIDYSSPNYRKNAEELDRLKHEWEHRRGGGTGFRRKFRRRH